jgi:hypothetical protein
MIADLESVRIAEMYYQDMYLKHLPIPHFKMPDVTIEIPIAVTQIMTPNKNTSNNTLLNNMKMRINNDLSNFLTRVLLALKDETTASGKMTLRTLPTRMIKIISTEEKSLEQRVAASCKNITNTVFAGKDYVNGNTVPIRITKLVDDLVLMLSQELTKNYLDYIGVERSQKSTKADEQSLNTILNMSRELFYDSLTHFMKENDVNLDVISGTTDLINLGDFKYLTVIKLTLREQEYEWAVGERDDSGIEERHLVVE